MSYEVNAGESELSSKSQGLRILLLNDNVRGTGSFYRCWHLAQELVRLGHDVCLITVSPSRRILPRRELARGVMIIESPNLLDLVYGLGPGYGIVGIPYRMLVGSRDSFDVVHEFESRPNVLLPGMFSRAINGCPLVADWADWWGLTRDGSGLQERRRWPAPQLETAMEDFIHRRADRVTTISTGLTERALSLGIPSDKVRRIPSGAPAESIRPMDRSSCRRELDIPPSRYLIGYVGSQVGDLEMLSAPLRKLRRAHPHVKLGIIGPRPPSSLLAGDSRDAVISFGSVPFNRLPIYLGACDSFVLPLRDTVFNRTRWPNKFGDYIAAGRPVLCTDVGDIARIVEAEKCGMVCHDLTEFVDQVEMLMDDRGSGEAMGASARRLAEGELSWRRLAMEFLEVYREAGARS